MTDKVWRPRSRSRQRPLRGEILVPGDKSISHRALILSALAPGPSRITGANLGEDVRATARVLSQLGARCDVAEHKGTVHVEGFGRRLREPDDVLDAGNSGTTMRTVLGVCAGVPGSAVLTGDDSLRRRPMLRVVGPLRQMGATIDGRHHGALPPLWIRGGELEGCEFELGVASAQVKTALLLAGLGARGRTSVREPGSSRDHTERMLAAAGVRLERAGGTVTLEGGQEPTALDRMVPGDISSAMFLVVAALLVPGSDLSIDEVGLNETRAGGLGVLARMGAGLEVERTHERGGEPVGTVRVRHSELTGTSIGPPEVPSLIDELPVLAVAATQAHGETVIRGAEELRVKETDRIEALVEGLGVLGADVEGLEDGLVVRGPTPLGGGEVDSRGDHRMALAFAVAGLVAADKVGIQGWACVNTSFPEFLEVLATAQERGR